MEEMNLIIAVDVPYEVQITATGIPMHEAKVEFCLPKRDVSYNFPARMVDDKKFVFILTDALKELINKTHEYKLYVYYGNARFEADEGHFNLVDKKAFDVEMQGDKDAKSLANKLLDKATKKPQSVRNRKETPVVTEEVKETPEVTGTPEVTPTKAKKKAAAKKVAPKVKATKPTPTPTVETTTTLQEAKEAIKKTIGGEEHVEVVQEGVDPNQAVKDILDSMNKTVTPSVELVENTTSTETQKPGKFFEEIDRMRNINERRAANKKIKAVIEKTTKK